MRRAEMQEYPEVVDFEAVSLLIDIVKNRQITERRKEACLAGWNIAGYLLRISVGVPTDNKVGAFYAHSGKLQDGLEELEDVLTTFDKKQEFTAENAKDAEDIGTVITVISIILNLLRALGFTKRVRETHTFGNAGMGVRDIDDEDQEYDEEDDE
jgi:hypothetical protein